MTRIAPVAAPDEAQRAALAKTPPGANGAPLNVFATLAHRPELLGRVNALGGYFRRRSTLPARERELVVLRVAARVASAYVATHHAIIGARAGLTTAEIAAARDPAVAYPWAPAERALLALADELLATHAVADATWAALDGHADEGQRLELLVLVGFYALMGGLANAAGTALDDPYVPEGASHA